MSGLDAKARSLESSNTVCITAANAKQPYLTVASLFTGICIHMQHTDGVMLGTDSYVLL